jgi:hypothetical protein
MIHDHYCRCRSCKPASHRLSAITPLHQPVPPHVRQAMDRIVMAVIGLASVCTAILALARG